MCGIAGIVGWGWDGGQLAAMVDRQQHRGPDARGMYVAPNGLAGLAHSRLSILDLSADGRQPMASADGRVWLSFNGEIYNYLELKRELHRYPFRTASDSEVILAAYEEWGTDCLSHFIGMFAFLLWDEREQCLFAARDRFGVKPLMYHRRDDGTLLLASEIKALHGAGIAARWDTRTWATYLTYGLSDHTSRTFWDGIESLDPGWALTWQNGRTRLWQWYDLAAHAAGDYDTRALEVVQEEYIALLTDSVRLRFRADVPVGINLSGGLDSSTLVGLVQAVQGPDSDVSAFSFVTGHAAYDELPWIQQMLAHTRHPSIVCPVRAVEVPDLAASVQYYEDEPFGGLPTLAYARLFECARQRGVIVLLDGQGMDEQWAGYDYYQLALDGPTTFIIQGTHDKPVRPECLIDEFCAQAIPFEPARPFSDSLRNVQYRDVRYTKIPRALRFNDRAAMRASTELREPFLDHRVVELAFRQPPDRKVRNGTRKWLLRQAVRELLPAGLTEAPKRPVQTPQREWLRDDLRDWATDCIEQAIAVRGGEWLKPAETRAEWQRFCRGASDNSYYVWQWISIGLMSACSSTPIAITSAMAAERSH
jgi:asparagine synthase (glutamine-hydrolysing)